MSFKYAGMSCLSCVVIFYDVSLTLGWRYEALSGTSLSGVTDQTITTAGHWESYHNNTVILLFSGE